MTFCLFSNPKSSRHLLGRCAVLLLFCMLGVTAVWMRLQDRDTLPKGQFTETDGYFYYWQASLISEHGQLPARDMHRWLPIGRDNRQTLNLYPYAVAYTHKAVSTVFSKVTLYDVALYMPVVCFCIGLGTLCLFLYPLYGLLFSLSVGLLLAVLPGNVTRSAIGFGDRDAWCLMLGLLSLMTYLTALQTQRRNLRFFCTLVSGFFVFLGGLSWEGFGAFGAVILVVELWRFLTSKEEDGLVFYILWVFTFVPTLYLFSPAYRSGYGFAKHLAVFMLAPPLIFLGMRLLRQLLLSKIASLRLQVSVLSLGLTFIGVSLGIGYVWVQHSTFADTTVFLNKNRLMQTVMELRPPNLNFWYSRYGCTFLIGSLGAILTAFSFCKRDSAFSFYPFALFTLITFFREPFLRVFGGPLGNGLLGLSLAGCVCAFLQWTFRRNVNDVNRSSPDGQRVENVSIAFLALFMIWVALAGDARRYHFFTGIPLAFFTIEGIRITVEALVNKMRAQNVLSHTTFKNILSAALLILLLFPGLGGFVRQAQTRTERPNMARLKDAPLSQAYHWMKTTLPETAVVAARWRYGSQLNVLAGVKTIIDPDHYIQPWIHLYRHYISLGIDPHEMLGFLKTHQATHVMSPQQSAPHAIEQAEASGSFVPVYPTSNFEVSPIKIWEIHYPPNIQTDVKYLKTGIPEIDDQLPLR